MPFSRPGAAPGRGLGRRQTRTRRSSRNASRISSLGLPEPTVALAHRPEAARLLLAARLVEALALGRRHTLARHLRVFGESICIKGAPRRPAAAAGSPRPTVVERKASPWLWSLLKGVQGGLDVV